MAEQLQLSQDNIKLIEQSMHSKMAKSTDGPCISYCYYDDAVSAWNSINSNDCCINSYYLFASNAMGMTSYGFYKANDNKIYIIEAFIGDIVKIYIPSKKMDFLKNVDFL